MIFIQIRVFGIQHPNPSQNKETLKTKIEHDVIVLCEPSVVVIDIGSSWLFHMLACQCFQRQSILRIQDCKQC